MTWTGLLSSLYVLEELGSDAEFSGLLLPHHFYVLWEALPKSKGMFIKTGRRPTLCLKWAFWAFSTLLGSQPQSCKNPGRFIFQI